MQTIGGAYVEQAERQLQQVTKNLVEMDEELLEHIYMSDKPPTEDVHHILKACLILLGYPKKMAGVRNLRVVGRRLDFYIIVRHSLVCFVLELGHNQEVLSPRHVVSTHGGFQLHPPQATNSDLRE